MVYRCKKAVAFGKPTKYIRKMQDGVRGEVMHTSERSYEPRYFKLYTSHTKSLAAAAEADAKDVSPSFRKWSRAGYILMAAAAVVACTKLIAPDKTDPSPSAVAGARTKEHAEATAQSARPAPGAQAHTETQPTPAPAAPPVDHPLSGLTLHVLGGVKVRDTIQQQFVLAQSGMPVQELSAQQIADAGYTVRAVSYCVAEVSYPGVAAFFARCDLPRVGLQAAGAG